MDQPTIAAGEQHLLNVGKELKKNPKAYGLLAPILNIVFSDAKRMEKQLEESRHKDTWPEIFGFCVTVSSSGVKLLRLMAKTGSWYAKKSPQFPGKKQFEELVAFLGKKEAQMQQSVSRFSDMQNRAGAAREEYYAISCLRALLLIYHSRLTHPELLKGTVVPLFALKQQTTIKNPDDYFKLMQMDIKEYKLKRAQKEVDAVAKKLISLFERKEWATLIKELKLLEMDITQRKQKLEQTADEIQGLVKNLAGFLQQELKGPVENDYLNHGKIEGSRLEQTMQAVAEHEKVENILTNKTIPLAHFLVAAKDLREDKTAEKKLKGKQIQDGSGRYTVAGFKPDHMQIEGIFYPDTKELAWIPLTTLEKQMREHKEIGKQEVQEQLQRLKKDNAIPLENFNAVALSGENLAGKVIVAERKYGMLKKRTFRFQIVESAKTHICLREFNKTGALKVLIPLPLVVTTINQTIDQVGLIEEKIKREAVPLEKDMQAVKERSMRPEEVGEKWNSVVQELWNRVFSVSMPKEQEAELLGLIDNLIIRNLYKIKGALLHAGWSEGQIHKTLGPLDREAEKIEETEERLAA
ncbi:hypothetical protein HZB01_05665 [Candidatus Woesearchaeota archaeon]|nr:hypothetical protein [Candidatus Woesearchaeota archaeon]